MILAQYQFKILSQFEIFHPNLPGGRQGRQGAKARWGDNFVA